jgi:XTP/dITP diphosphohydrolase
LKKMTTTLLIATTNPGKIAEIRALLAGVPYALATLDEIPAIAEPDETGATFDENARHKALHYAAASGLLTVAEDSGLEIDALGGAPGIHSSRWNGSSYPEKFARIYAELAARGVAGSPARFVCALALVRRAKILFETRGLVEGEVAPEPRGAHGFGYDPIFLYPPYGQTLGEMADERKRAVSHRGAAFLQLGAHLRAHADL